MNSKEMINGGRRRATFCILFLLIAIAAAAMTAGCTGTANESTTNTPQAGTPAVTAEVTETSTPAPTEEIPDVDMNEVIAIDLISMYQDVQDENPLAFDYVILPTWYTGVNDDGDYEFGGTITNYNSGGKETNYLGVLFTVKDDESETGYGEWVYKGLKYDIFGGDEGQDITIEFTVDKEDIPEGKTLIMTGYELNPI